MNTDGTLLIELHYFPSIQYFSKTLSYPIFILEQKENYVKRSFRNRTHIAAANGLLSLSIPLKKGKNQQQPIREVRISYEESWQKKHWTAICSAYGNAPFFEYYKDDIEPIFIEKADYLFDFNLKILNILFFVLDIQPAIQFSQSYLPSDLTEIIDFRNKINPKPSISITDRTFLIKPYFQVFAEKNGFLPNLSILDLIFCKGPETVSILEASFLRDKKLR